ncbi:biliverdin-producing heme oxygenase [Streptomyces sp. NBC_00454]|uniref:biliverdin-producing heme oxygenase n=1 Tax=Streptomyces sp. NBC_00454 TaxID=2975747 RepID=UPI0030E33F3C
MSATVMERLRAGTRGAHDGLEGARFSTAMTDGTLPLDRYVGQLAAYRVVLEALEGELSRATDPSVGSVWSEELRKLPLVDRDLNHFGGGDGLGDGSSSALAAEAGKAFARAVRDAAAADPRALLGFLYVMEGSTLGGMVLGPYVTKAYRLDAGDGVAYYGCGDRERWARFTARMNAALTAPEAQEPVIAAAREAYRHTIAITRALSAGLPAAT